MWRPSSLLAAAGDDASAQDAAGTCDWSALEQGNSMVNWKGDRASIKYAYQNNLKGKEIFVWWPGRAAQGECNDLTQTGRGCSYRAKLLNDPECTDENRCLHFAARDGEPTHTYTCPTWVRGKNGKSCPLPDGWQACPSRFQLKRIDSGVPQALKKALDQKCAEPAEASAAGGEESRSQDHCTGSTAKEPLGQMVFDLKRNSWYRCTENFKCEPLNVRAIVDKCASYSGTDDASARPTCSADQSCFVRKAGSKSAYECVNNDKAWVVSDGDDVTKLAVPWPLAVLPPAASFRGDRPRSCRSVARLAEFL